MSDGPIVLFDSTGDPLKQKAELQRRIQEFFLTLVPCPADQATEFLSADKILQRLVDRTGTEFDTESLIIFFENNKIQPIQVEGESLYCFINRPL